MRIVRFLVFVSFLGLTLGNSNLPNHTELVVSVLADESWVRGEGMTMDSVRDLMTESITSSRSTHVSMEILFNIMTSPNMTDDINIGNIRTF